MRKVIFVLCLLAFAGLAMADEGAPPVKNARDVAGPVPERSIRTGDCSLSLADPNGTIGLFGWDTDEIIANYLDPAVDQDSLSCFPPYYPFQINSVDVLLAVWGSDSTTIIGHTVTFNVHITCPEDQATGTVPAACKGPNGSVIATAQGSYTVTSEDWNGSGLVYINLPFQACVSGPFFVQVEFVSWTGAAGYAPAPLFMRNAYIPDQNCRAWYHFILAGYPICWHNHFTDFSCGTGCFPGPWYLWVNGTAGAECTPYACTPAPRTYPGDDATNPILITSQSWTQTINLCSFASDYDQRTDDQIAGGSFTGRGGDAVLEFSFDPNLPEVCFSITIAPACEVPTMFRLRSWLEDSYGTLYDGTPRFPSFNGAQTYDFTASGLGCLTPDVYRLYLDVRNCCCPVVVTYTGDQPLPVKLTGFDAVAGDGEVSLTWRTESERSVAYYEIIRNNAALTRVNGMGDSPSGHTYTYVDRDVVNGTTYSYRLKSVDINGDVIEHELTAEATPRSGLVHEYALEQNYPNPFNPATAISYAVKEAGVVTLKVFTVDGREVATLVNARQDAGRYTVNFNAEGLATGLYLYKIEVNGYSATHKMILMK